MRGKRDCPQRKRDAELNLFVFVRNAPPNRVDILGLFDFCQCLKITEKVLVYKKGWTWSWNNPYYSEAILPPNAKPSTKGGYLCDRAYRIELTVEPRDGRNLLVDLNAPGNDQTSDCWLWDGSQTYDNRISQRISLPTTSDLRCRRFW